MSVYDITYKSLGHTRPIIYTTEEMGEYLPPKTGIELDGNLSLTLSSSTAEISLQTYKIFHSENQLETKT